MKFKFPEKAMPKVGDIFRNSWGYDQTNVDWYQVVRVTAKCVIMKEIGSKTMPTGMMCGESTPMPDEFIGPEIRKKVYFSTMDNAARVSMPYGSCCQWDGKPAYKSWYA